ncbi:MAG: hypothetical protein HND52_02125 [Ignavibacteriae bacterium]|nr:hypothetical protein [Ignavibacteriota bacterium]NOG96747.1 hypothetical protein [Ignavibacteriota bacterium]
MLKWIVKIFILLIIVSCSNNSINNPTNNEETFAKIVGVIVDSLNLIPLDDVTVSLHEKGIYRITDTLGQFSIDSLNLGTSTIVLKTIGYEDKSIKYYFADTIQVNDTIVMSRQSYNYSVLDFDDLPHQDTTCYGYSLMDFDRYYHYYNPEFWDETAVNRFIDSLIIKIQREYITLDTLWYQSYMPQCSHPTVEWLPVIAIKSDAADEEMINLGFHKKRVDNYSYWAWYQCENEPMHYRKYGIN